MTNEEKFEHQKRLCAELTSENLKLKNRVSQAEKDKVVFELLYKNYKERYVKMLERFLDLLNLQKEFFDYKQPSVLKKCKREEANLKFVIETRLKQEKELEAQRQ